MITWAQLTGLGNAPGGVEPVGYSYWSNINQHAGQTSLFVFIGRPDALPLLLEVRSDDLTVLSARDIPRPGTGEGWYFSAARPFDLYVLEGASLLRYQVVTGAVEVVFTLADYYGRYLWQAHSSADDAVHSATVRGDDYQDLGCVVFRHGRETFFPKRAGYDECQIDASGRYLVIKEGAGQNRIIDLDTGDERTIENAGHAVGHSDCGDGTLVGEDDQGACWSVVRWNLREPDGAPRVVYSQRGPDWGEGMGHISVRGERALLSTVDQITLIQLDGSGQVLEAWSPFVDLNATGGGDNYRKRPKANLDPTGQYACWTSNHGSDRLDLFLARIDLAPQESLMPPFDTLKAIRPLYPTPMSEAQLGEMLNAVAWTHRAEGWGVLAKPSGANCPQPQTGTRISKDILMHGPTTIVYDVLIDSDGAATPTWAEKGPIDPARFVAPVDAGVTVPGPTPPPATGYPGDQIGWTIGEPLFADYAAAGQAPNPGMGVWFWRTAWDVSQGESTDSAIARHRAEWRAILGLPPL